MRGKKAGGGLFSQTGRFRSLRGGHAQKKKSHMLIPRGDSEVGDGYLYGEGFIPGGSFVDWIESGIFDEEVEGGRRMHQDAEGTYDEGSSADAGLSEAFASRSRRQGSKGGRKRPRRAALAIAACLAVSVLAGGAVFFLGGVDRGGSDDVVPAAEAAAQRFVPSPPEPAGLSEEDLDKVVAVYVQDGVEHEVSARDVRNSVRAYPVASPQGLYPAPTTEDIRSCIVELVLSEEARKAGIEVTEKEVSVRSRALFGSDDYAALGRSFGVSADELRASVEAACAVEGLKKRMGRPAGVVPPDPLLGEASGTAAPEGSESDPGSNLEGYGAYIVALLGDEWDVGANAWARTDGPYFQALGEAFDPSQATYDQAVAAYSRATEGTAGDSKEWQAFFDDVCGRIGVALYGSL